MNTDKLIGDVSTIIGLAVLIALLATGLPFLLSWVFMLLWGNIAISMSLPTVGYWSMFWMTLLFYIVVSLTRGSYKSKSK